MMYPSMVLDGKDRWARYAIYPHLISPVMLFLLIAGLLIFGSLLPSLIALPFLLYSISNFIHITREGYQPEGKIYGFSVLVMLLMLFFPFLVISDPIDSRVFSVLYLLFILPLFLIHMYSAIHNFTHSDI